MKRTYKSFEFDNRQYEKQNSLLCSPPPVTQKEKDIWNLKFLRYSILYGSFDYNAGMIGTLDRAIKRLERSKK